MEAIIANEAANIAATQHLCGNHDVEFNAFADADFSVVAKCRADHYTAKAASVKSEAARAKWAALADLWSAA